MNPRQKIVLAVVLLANIALWGIPSDVVEQVARDKHTLLGRYSREHFALNVAVLVISAVGLYVDQGRGEKYKRRWFQVVATALFLAPGVALLDFAARSAVDESYIFDSVAYHRPAAVSFSRHFEDRPTAARTYPNAAGGFGVVECAYRTDERGFRNRATVDRADVVVLGDSFAEGSKVSDEHAWPVLLAEGTGASIYNLGMSGYAPAHYLAALDQYGLPLSPSIVLCMLYEGNDFRTSGEKGDGGGGERSWSRRVKSYIKQSPVRSAVDRAFVKWFGPIGSRRPFDGLGVLSWLPLGVPRGEAARYYAFAPKQLLTSRWEVGAFAASGEWSRAAGALSEIKLACDRVGARLIVVYAPTKAHVILPLARDRVSADQLRAFAGLRAKQLPEAGEFAHLLFDRLDSMERVVEAWCAARDVVFVGATEALRERAAAGEQVYYTYDQHWTPIGHDVVAEVVRAALPELGSAVTREGAGESRDNEAAAFTGDPKSDR